MRGPRLFLSAATALALVGAALVPATAASPPEPLVGVEVEPANAAGSASATIGSDAVYAVTYEAYSDDTVVGQITSRPMQRAEGSTTLGPRSFVGRTTAERIAEHEGVLAYVRESDGRAVLRAADGSETVPAWSEDPSFTRFGPLDMNDDWVASWGTLSHRSSAAQVDLVAASEPVLDLADELVIPTGVALTDDRVVWTVALMHFPLHGGYLMSYWVLTAPLTRSGVGQARVIGSSAHGATIAGVGDDHVVCTYVGEQDGAFFASAYVVDLATFTNVASYPLPDFEDSDVRTDVVVTDDDVVLGTARVAGGVPTVVRRHALGPGTDARTAYLESGSVVVDADGDLVASVDQAGAVHLVDTAGGEVVIDEPVTVAEGPFVTQTPARLLFDTAVTPGEPRCVQVTGEDAGVDVPDGATGAIVNVAAVRPSDVGYVVVYPDTLGNGATPMPAKGSTVNFEPRQDVANATFVALPPSGRICYATRGAARSGVVIDVSGYMLDGSGVVMRPTERVLDTRERNSPITGPLALMKVYTLDVAAEADLPESATAVIVNVAATRTYTPGHLRLFPGGSPVPQTATLNYAYGVDKANGAVVPLSEDGTISLYSYTLGPSVDVVIDVVGYVETGSPVQGVGPSRLLDSREGAILGTARERLPRRTVASLDVTATGLVPDDATAVLLNATAVSVSSYGHLRVYPDVAGTGRSMPPDISTINYVPGRDIPNLVVVAVPADGKVALWSDQHVGGVHVVVDLVGYVRP